MVLLLGPVGDKGAFSQIITWVQNSNLRHICEHIWKFCSKMAQKPEDRPQSVDYRTFLRYANNIAKMTTNNKHIVMMWNLKLINLEN